MLMYLIRNSNEYYSIIVTPYLFKCLYTKDNIIFKNCYTKIDKILDLVFIILKIQDHLYKLLMSID